MVGFLGGWTTYSTLAVDATLLAKDGDVGTCLAYVAATVIGGLAFVIVGHDLGRRLAASSSASAPTLGIALLVACAGGVGAIPAPCSSITSDCAWTTPFPSAPWS